MSTVIALVRRWPLLARRQHPLALLVLGYCFLLGFISGGIFQSLTVFVLPIGADLGLARGPVASIFGITFAASGLASPLAGWVFDRIGPRLQYVAGITLMACGYITASFAESLLILQLSLGAMVGLGGTMAGGVPHAALAARWFDRNAGSAMGLIFSAGGLASFAMAPLMQLSVESFGWRRTADICAIVIAALVIPTLLMPWERLMRGEPAYRRVLKARALTAAKGGVTLGSALQAPAFWGLFFVYFFTGASTSALSLHMVSYLTAAGIAPLVAAAAFGFAGALTPLGMIGFGALGDRIGRAQAAAFSFALTGIAVLGLFFVSRWPALILLLPAIACFGLSAGSRGPLVSAIAMNMFAGNRVGAIYGGIALGGGIGGGFGVWFGGAIQDWTGTTDALMMFGALFLLVGASPFGLIRALRRS